MKYLRYLGLLLIVGSCGFAEIADPIYTFGDALQSFSVKGIEGQFELNKVTVVVPDAIDVSRITPSFATLSANLYVGNEKQISGISLQDFTKPITYRAETYDGKKYSYIVYVRNEGVSVVGTSSNVIKIDTINQESVDVSIARSPSTELIGVLQDNISYCVNISDTAPSPIFAMNQHLMYAEEFVCLETYSFEDLPKSFDFVEDREVFVNYVAIYDGVKYPYNRLYIDNNMEFFTGTCQDFYDGIEDAGSLVLTGDLNCEDVETESLAIADLKLNGNGYTFYNDYSNVYSYNQSYMANVNYVNINGIANEITFSIFENITVNDTCIFNDGYTGIIAHKIFDLVLNNIQIDATIYSTGNHAGLITGAYINNFLMIYPIMSNMKLTGSVNGVDYIGGAFGFIISDFYLKNVIVNVEVSGSGEYVGCLAGAIANQPICTNVQELCE